jgi:TolB protein
MRRTRAPGYHLFAIAAAGLLCVGCQSLGPTSRPLTAAEPPGKPFTQTPATASPQDVALFGTHPDGQRVPYETRLLTNMTRHTFSSIGRDFDPDLHPDGRTMVFASTRNSERPDVFMKDVDGYAITQLTSDPADDIQPRFSPDGESVVFCSNRSGNWDIWLINRDGTELTQLTHDPSDEIAPCFSPDGKHIAFTAWGGRSHQWEIWSLSIDRPGIRRFLCYGMFPDWSCDGQRITFQRARQRGTRWFSIWSVELIGDEVRHPTELAYSDSSACIAPRWSPDGGTIVYCCVRQTAATPDDAAPLPADIWMVDVRSGTRLKITDGAVGAFNPTCSSTGRVYFVSARAGVENIWSLQTELAGYSGPAPQAARSPQESQASVNTPLETKGK